MLTIPGTSAIEIGVRPGSELPFHASAQGKVLLAFAAPAMRKRLLATPRRKMTEKTVVDPASLERELALIVRAGYAVAPEQAMLGLNAIAIPIFDGPTLAPPLLRWSDRFSFCQSSRAPRWSKP